MALIEYKIDNGNLSDTLNLTFEIYAISGMTPDKILYDGKEVKWDAADVRRLRGGEISENEYMRKHSGMLF